MSSVPYGYSVFISLGLLMYEKSFLNTFSVLAVLQLLHTDYEND